VTFIFLFPLLFNGLFYKIAYFLLKMVLFYQIDLFFIKQPIFLFFFIKVAFFLLNVNGFYC